MWAPALAGSVAIVRHPPTPLISLPARVIARRSATTFTMAPPRLRRSPTADHTSCVVGDRTRSRKTPGTSRLSEPWSQVRLSLGDDVMDGQPVLCADGAGQVHPQPPRLLRRQG